MKTLKKLGSLFTILVVAVACSSDDGGPSYDAPEFSYSETSVPVIFSASGSLTAPQTEWHNGLGVFTVAPPITGLSINPQTGTLSWDRSLPPGTHTITVTATNEGGSASEEITLNNAFNGIFTGTYIGTAGESWFYELEFDAHGGMITRENDESSPERGTGTYTLTDNTILVNYTYDDGGAEYSIRLNLTQTTSAANLDGAWYHEFGAEESQLGGAVSVSME